MPDHRKLNHSAPGYDPTEHHHPYPNTDARRAYMRQHMALRRELVSLRAENEALRAKLQTTGNLLNEYAGHPVIRMITSKIASIG
jgi:hypothetical protein